MSTKDWKNRELPSLLTEKWGFSFNMLTESQEEEVVEEGMCGTCGKSPCCCPTMEEGEDNFDYRGMPPECRPGGEEENSQKCIDAAMMAQGVFGEGEEIEEGASSSGRVATPDRAQGGDRREDDERKRPMEEGEDKKPDADGDGVPDYADKKPGEDDNEEKGEEEKSDKDLSKVPPQLRKHVKGKMDEAQIRNLIRKLVKEAMNKKENK